jgi:hypothetical protein
MEFVLAKALDHFEPGTPGLPAVDFEADETMIPFRTKNDPVVVPAGRSGGRQDAGRRRGRPGR